MPQISFTKNNEHVYDRFSRLLLEEQLKRGKLTAPQMLDLVLDKWEGVEPVSLRAYIADAEANEQVIIKQSDGALYLEKMLAHNHNAYLTPHKDEAMIFDNHDQAKAFLRKCEHEVGNWILEPLNDSK